MYYITKYIYSLIASAESLFYHYIQYHLHP